MEKKWFNRLNNDNNYSIIGLVFLLCKNRWLRIHQEIGKIQYKKIKQTFLKFIIINLFQRAKYETESQWSTQHDPQWIFKSFKILSVLVYFDEMIKNRVCTYTRVCFKFPWNRLHIFKIWISTHLICILWSVRHWFFLFRKQSHIILDE